MSTYYSVDIEFKQPTATNSAEWLSSFQQSGVAAINELAEAQGLWCHSVVPLVVGRIQSIWELKYGADLAVFQNFLDVKVGKGLANCTANRINTSVTYEAPHPNAPHFKCAAADVKITDLIKAEEAADRTYTAFEYYPPRSAEGVKNLLNRFRVMAAQQPLYADMTWGAGGSTSDLTLDLCTKMTYDAGMVANMHLTCTNMEAEKVDIALNSAREVGIRNIVALRGDPPAGKEEWKATEGGFSCALDLVKHMRATHGDYFCISVAGYPEGHPNAIKPVEDESKLTEDELTRVVRNKDGIFCCHAADYESEMAYLKEKVDAGADFIITQMFFETAVFVKFVKDCRARGIMCPVMPGIMLIQAYGGFSRMTLMCKSRVPQEVFDRVEAVKDDKDALKEYGTELGAQICNELIAAGFKGLHLYTLNLEAVTYGVMDKLGLKKAVPK